MDLGTRERKRSAQRRLMDVISLGEGNDRGLDVDGDGELSGGAGCAEMWVVGEDAVVLVGRVWALSAWLCAEVGRAFPGNSAVLVARRRLGSKVGVRT